MECVVNFLNELSNNTETWLNLYTTYIIILKLNHTIPTCIEHKNGKICEYLYIINNDYFFPMNE